MCQIFDGGTESQINFAACVLNDLGEVDEESKEIVDRWIEYYEVRKNGSKARQVKNAMGSSEK